MQKPEKKRIRVQTCPDFEHSVQARYSWGLRGNLADLSTTLPTIGVEKPHPCREEFSKYLLTVEVRPFLYWIAPALRWGYAAPDRRAHAADGSESWESVLAPAEHHRERCTDRPGYLRHRVPGAEGKHRRRP